MCTLQSHSARLHADIQNVLRFAGVEGVEKSGDNGHKFGVYRFSVFDVVSIMSSMARRGVAGI